MRADQYPDVIVRLYMMYLHHGIKAYERQTIVYPFVAAHTNLDVPLDSILSRRPPQTIRTRSTLPFYDDTLVPQLQAQGKRVYNGVTFAFKQLTETNGVPRLHAELGSYFDHISTCVALENEFVAGGSTPWRDALHATVSPAQLMTNGAGRSAALGVGVLTVFKTSAGYRLLLAERSANTAHKGGSYHVAPAFIFQPSAKSYPAHEWKLSYQIKREYVEELFDEAEMEAGSDFKQAPAAQQLDAMLADGRAALHFIGIAMNLLTTQVAVCALLVIHDEDWFSERIGSAWEMNGVHTIRFQTDLMVLAGLRGEYYRLTPIGAAALWLGVDRAREMGLG